MTVTNPTPGVIREQPLTLRVSGWEVPAALTLPAEDGRPVTSAILLIPGSLFSDVNGDYPAWNMFPHVYGHLARQLSARGHAVYRFAKMGPGTGSVAVDQTQADRVRNWPGRLIVARAALAAMRGALPAASVASPRVVLAGHSEGAVIASLLAVGESPDALDGVVLLSGPAIGILGIMREQLPMMLPTESVEQGMADFDAALVHVRAGQPIPDDLLSRPSIQGLKGVGLAGQAYLRDSDATDPAETAGQIRQPVLLVQGGRDSSVPRHHAERLAAARGARPTETLFVPELQHMYKPLPEGLSAFEAFGLQGETDPRVADGVDAWVRRLPPRPGAA
jgi:uncharacterized protein